MGRLMRRKKDLEKVMEAMCSPPVVRLIGLTTHYLYWTVLRPRVAAIGLLCGAGASCDDEGNDTRGGGDAVDESKRQEMFCAIAKAFGEVEENSKGSALGVTLELPLVLMSIRVAIERIFVKGYPTWLSFELLFSRLQIKREREGNRRVASPSSSSSSSSSSASASTATAVASSASSASSNAADGSSGDHEEGVGGEGAGTGVGGVDGNDVGPDGVAADGSSSTEGSAPGTPTGAGGRNRSQRARQRGKLATVQDADKDKLRRRMQQNKQAASAVGGAAVTFDRPSDRPASLQIMDDQITLLFDPDRYLSHLSQLTSGPAAMETISTTRKRWNHAMRDHPVASALSVPTSSGRVAGVGEGGDQEERQPLAHTTTGATGTCSSKGNGDVRGHGGGARRPVRPKKPGPEHGGRRGGRGGRGSGHTSRGSRGSRGSLGGSGSVGGSTRRGTAGPAAAASAAGSPSARSTSSREAFDVDAALQLGSGDTGCGRYGRPLEDGGGGGGGRPPPPPLTFRGQRSQTWTDHMNALHSQAERKRRAQHQQWITTGGRPGDVARGTRRGGASGRPPGPGSRRRVAENTTGALSPETESGAGGGGVRAPARNQSQNTRFVAGRGACRYYTTSSIVRSVYSKPQAGETRHFLAHGGFVSTTEQHKPPASSQHGQPGSDPDVGAARGVVAEGSARGTGGTAGGFLTPANQARLLNDVLCSKLKSQYAREGLVGEVRGDIMGLG
jgi:hypothetical protein